MLRAEPPQVRPMHHRLRPVVVPPLAQAQRLQQPFGGEHRHLRVIGDRAVTSVRDIESLDSLLAVALVNLSATHELDGRAERVADRAAEEAAAKGFPCWHWHNMGMALES